MKQLFDVCNGKINTKKTYEFIELLQFGQMLNYQDPLTGKTPLMALLHNASTEKARIIHRVITHHELNYTLVDIEGNNLCHYLVDTHQTQLMSSFLRPADFIALLFQKNKKNIMPWDSLFCDIYFIEVLNEKKLWHKMKDHHFDFFCKIIHKICDALNEKNYKIKQYYQCLEWVIKKSEIRSENREFIDKFLISNPGEILRLVDHAFVENAPCSIVYFMYLIKKGKIHVDCTRNWLIKSLHADDYNGSMLLSVIQNFGGNYFPFENKDGTTILHVAAKNNNMLVLKKLFNLFDMRSFDKQDQYGRYPIHYARSEELVVYFNKKGISCSLIDKKGNGILHYLLQEKDHMNWNDLAFLFIDDRMDLSYSNQEGKTPFDIALQSNKSYAIDAIFNLFKDSRIFFSKEALISFFRSALQVGNIDIIKKLQKSINKAFWQKDLSILSNMNEVLQHNYRLVIQSISNAFSLSVDVGSIDVPEMEYVVARLKDKLGKDFDCSIFNVYDMLDWLKNIKKNLNNFQGEYKKYFACTNKSHWMCGEIFIHSHQVEKILIIDSLVKYHPTNEAYMLCFNIFPEAVIYVSGVIQQGSDNLCALYAYDTIKNLWNIRALLPDRYKNDLYAYFDDHLFLKNEVQEIPIDFLRQTDKVCRLPGLMMRNVRSLNGKLGTYSQSKEIFWMKTLDKEEMDTFNSKKRCGLLIKNHFLDQHALLKYNNYQYILTEDIFYFFDKSEKKLCILVEASKIGECAWGLFKENIVWLKQTTALTKTQLKYIAILTGHCVPYNKFFFSDNVGQHIVNDLNKRPEHKLLALREKSVSFWLKKQQNTEVDNTQSQKYN